MRELEVYLAGCAAKPHCRGCHNPETWDFNQGTPYDQWVLEKLSIYAPYLNRIHIMGGEPLDQDRVSLAVFLCNLNMFAPTAEIYLWTRFEWEELPKGILRSCDAVKTGAYDESLRSDSHIVDGYHLASTNQTIHHTGRRTKC